MVLAAELARARVDRFRRCWDSGLARMASKSQSFLDRVGKGKFDPENIRLMSNEMSDIVKLQ